jgi:hypothetical protein
VKILDILADPKPDSHYVRVTVYSNNNSDQIFKSLDGNEHNLTFPQSANTDQGIGL